MDDPDNNPSIPKESTAKEAPPKPRTFADFLESCGPDSSQYVSGLLGRDYVGQTCLLTPEIELHCDSEICSGVRRFKCYEGYSISSELEFRFVKYVCKNCGKTGKMFALTVAPDETKSSGHVLKLGEAPPFGPPTPPRVMKLVAEDRELFLKGRRAELHGLGIGAFAYYRRVVEEQKGRIIEEIGKVATKIKPSKETAELFARAMVESQFKTAIDMIHRFRL